jgi:ABC-type glutathione transport system ATPase component
MTSRAILSLVNVVKQFEVGKRTVRAVDGVSLDVEAGECLAIVGESGSGKTTIANMILGIHPPTSGAILFRGQELPARRPRALRRQIQLVQQNPLSSLNPRRTVESTVRLALDVHGHGTREERRGRVIELLEEVGLDPALARRSPAGLSGGQRQRIAIARALACQPDLVVLDEPTSALDVLVQARVLALLDRLRRSHGLTYVFITHDLSVVRNVADRVAVFQKGRLVECAETEIVFRAPVAEYTRSLIAAVPVVSEDEQALRARLSQEGTKVKPLSSPTGI